jgi:hypothetical protein
MSKPYFDFKAKRWYTTYKPDKKGEWDGEHPLAYREYVDGEPQPEEISQFDHARLTSR